MFEFFAGNKKSFNETCEGKESSFDLLITIILNIVWNRMPDNFYLFIYNPPNSRTKSAWNFWFQWVGGGCGELLRREKKETKHKKRHTSKQHY